MLPPMPPDLDELSVSHQLFGKIAEANLRLGASRVGGFESLPSYDGHQAPLDSGGPIQPSDRKRPDFVWSVQDHTAESGMEGCLEFVVECKRLGDELQESTFGYRYVDDGVLRFVRESHRYGQRGESGAMVGYVQRSDCSTIYSSVSDRMSHHGLPHCVAPSDWNQPVSELRQVLQRTFQPTPFLLVHLWVDLRGPAAHGRRDGELEA